MTRFTRKTASSSTTPTRAGEFISGQRRMGRRRRLSAVRHDVGECDVRDADGVPRSSRAPSPMRSMRAMVCRGRMASRTCSTRRGTGSSGCCACSPSDSTMSTSSATIATTRIWDLPTTDSSDYGWGKGRTASGVSVHREAAGTLQAQEPLDRLASTAGKYASAFALGAQSFAQRDPRSPATLRERALAAYELGRAHPGRVPDRARRARPTSTRKTTGPTTWSSAPRSSMR